MTRWGLRLTLALAAFIACSGGALAQEVQPNLAMLRVVHGAPNAPPVDVWLDGIPAFVGVSYTNITPYQTITIGTHSIQVVQSGTQVPVLFQGTVSLQMNSYDTLMVAPAGSGVTVLPTVDGNCLPPNRIAAVRFVNLSPNAPRLDAVLRGNVGVSRAPVEIVIGGIASSGASSYTNVVSGAYDIDLREPGTNRVLAQVLGVPLVQATTYTVYGVGLAGGQPSLQGLLTSDAPPGGR